MSVAERPPFVWVKQHAHSPFARVPLQGLLDVADLAAAAAAVFGFGGGCLELLLAAPPSAQPPPPAVIAAALLNDPLLMTVGLLGAGVARGCWLLARATADAQSAALARAEAAEAALAAEKASRMAAEAALVVVKAEAHKKTFMNLMLSFSSAGSGDTAASHADEARRHAPLAEIAPLAVVLDALPSPSPGDTSLAWKAFAAAHARMPRPSRRKLNENRDVHPTIGALIGAALGQHLRLWHNSLAEDDVDRVKIAPDFTVSHARDATPSTIGALLLVEVKLPGSLTAACTQACAYLRRSIFKRCAEADARGEGMDGICAYALATDGESMVALKMHSGAPPPGASFEGATPCPVLESPAMPLLAWDFRSAPPAWGTRSPPEGFSALHRLCAAPAAALAAEVIYSQLRVQLLPVERPQEGGGAAGSSSSSGGGGGGGGGGGAAGLLGAGGAGVSLLALGTRLGCGGSSDVYECSAELGVAAAAAARAPLAVKVSRFTTALVQRCFVRERDALLALAGAAARGLVPTLVATGTREGGAADWPVLLLQPCGQSLPSWVAERVAERVAAAAALQGGGGGGGGGGGSGSSSKGLVSAARAACATAVTLRLLDALQAAHAASLVHCDVRPSNVVVVPGQGAMLVDWGISRATSTEAQGCGLPAYADARVFLQGSYLSRPAQDVTADVAVPGAQRALHRALAHERLTEYHVRGARGVD